MRQTLRSDALAIATAGIEAADAGVLAGRALSANEGQGAWPAEARNERRRLHIMAAGKAAHAMAGAAVRALGERVRSGLIVAPTEHQAIAPLDAMTGGHPLPTVDSERAGRRALALAGSVATDETLLVLLSGGASALLAVPADDVTLEDKRRATSQLLLAGADIQALNTVRRHLSAIKGGWLAAGVAGSCHTLAVSDVVGDDLAAIGSGPTVADPSTFGDALDVLRAHGGVDAYPAAVVDRLRAGARGERVETPKPGDPRLARASAMVIGGRRDAMQGAARAAESRGYRVIQLESPIVGEARDVASSYLRDALASAADDHGPVCVVSSGETTVHVAGSGRGGRNQELALAAATTLGSANRQAVLASLGTDGIDGPTDAAGALVDWTSLARAAAAGLDVADALTRNDAYPFFDRLGDLIRTGPTGTNVGDLQVLLLRG